MLDQLMGTGRNGTHLFASPPTSALTIKYVLDFHETSRRWILQTVNPAAIFSGYHNSATLYVSLLCVPALILLI